MEGFSSKAADVREVACGVGDAAFRAGKLDIGDANCGVVAGGSIGDSGGDSGSGCGGGGGSVTLNSQCAARTGTPMALLSSSVLAACTARRNEGAVSRWKVECITATSRITEPARRESTSSCEAFTPP